MHRPGKRERRRRKERLVSHDGPYSSADEAHCQRLRLHFKLQHTYTQCVVGLSTSLETPAVVIAAKCSVRKEAGRQYRKGHTAVTLFRMSTGRSRALLRVRHDSSLVWKLSPRCVSSCTVRLFAGNYRSVKHHMESHDV